MNKQEFNASGFVTVKGARTHNLKNVNVEIPRNAMVVFTGVSGSGKSSLAFGTLYAEAQRRYMESISPYARRLINQLEAPDMDRIDGLPPAVALQQRRGAGSIRSSVGSITNLSDLLRLLYSRAGDYPPDGKIIYAEGFSPNNPAGACPQCQGLGRVFDVTEALMVPDRTLSIRQKAIQAWPPGWAGQNQKDILISLGYDIDIPWRDLPEKTRNWILYTDEQPEVPVYPRMDAKEVQDAMANNIKPNYMGTFTSAKRYVLHTFRNSQSAAMKKRAERYLTSIECPVCDGKRLKKESLSVKFERLDITEMSRLSMKDLHKIFSPYVDSFHSESKKKDTGTDNDTVVSQIGEDICRRLNTILDLGLGHLTLERTAPSLSAGELQRLRLASQLHANLFGVTYVLDEPSAGLHPADTQALMGALNRLKSAGNSLFIVEHDIDVIVQADWIVDVGPYAGEQGGNVLYSGIPGGLKSLASSVTAKYLFNKRTYPHFNRKIHGWIELTRLTKNNLVDFDASFPLGVFTSVTGVSGSGKSTLVSQALVQLVAKYLNAPLNDNLGSQEDYLEEELTEIGSGTLALKDGKVKRLIVVDQKPIGRTPRSNLATYTGLFDHIRTLFAGTPLSKKRKYDPGRFSFNVSTGRCGNCKGEGFIMVELMFLPSVYSRCPICHGSRYNEQTLDVTYRDKNIAEVLEMTVDEAYSFFADIDVIQRPLDVVRQVGLGYLRLGQPATELSGGEAQRIKLATELQRASNGNTLYILDEPTTGLHPSDVEKLLTQLNRLVDTGNTVIVVEHDMDVIAQSDWVIDIGPGGGSDGGKLVAQGPPTEIVKSKKSITARYLVNRVSQTNC